MMRDPLALLLRLAPRGDVSPLPLLGGHDMLLLRHPEDIERVLVTDNRRFPKRHPFLAEMRRIVGDGIATSQDDLWLRQRRLIQPAFGRERVVAYADAIGRHAAAEADRWRAGEVRDLYADFTRLVLRSTAGALFSATIDREQEILDVVSVVMDHFERPAFVYMPWLTRLPLPHMRRVRAATARIRALAAELVAARRADPSPPSDLLTALLAARDDDGAPMSERQIHDEVLTLYIAGYEPMAVALGWIFHALGEHPAELARVAEEARAAVGDRVAAHADLPRLPLTAAAIDEALRLYPPAWSSVREVDEACELRGHPAARGSMVWFSSWLVHRDPRWFDDPFAFRPSRWHGDLARRLPRGAYFPYGLGPRMCIGAALASAELPLIVATILSRWRVEPVPGRAPRLFPSINLRPHGGVWMRLSPW